MKPVYLVLSAVVFACLIAVSSVSLHSVWEIHYLKSFYPAHFSVSEAADAALVELIKVTLVALPLLLVIFVCLFLIRQLRRP
ncbi:MAG: hypothetical protein P8013_04370 [Candidatus Sulfobium sp.]